MSEKSTIHPVLKKTSDFSDSLSPMLVKELRQGLKGNSFMILFIAIQAVLSILISGQSFSSAYDSTGRDISTSVFICIGLATCVLIPLRAISTIATEMKELTIDLMVITKLSAWRIVLGKWISLVSQSALIIAAVTPYLILRYFFGGMHLFAELMILFTIFLTSAGLTAVFIGLSSLPSLILRSCIGLAIAFFVALGVIGLFLDSWIYLTIIKLCSFQFDGALPVYLLLILGVIYLGWLALDYAAGSIAPISENRTTPRRLISLGIVALLTIICLLSEPELRQGLPIMMVIFSVPISIISLTEHPYTTATVSVPFIKKGTLGKFTSYFLYPGWASGMNFVMILFGLTLLSTVFYNPRYSGDHLSQEIITFTCICFSCILFPLLLTRIFFRNVLQLLVFYLGGVVVSGISWLLVVIIVEETRSYSIYNNICWFPPVQFNIFGRSSTEGITHFIALPTFFIYWVTCFTTTSKYWKHIRNNHLQARKIIIEEQKLTENS